MRVQNKIAQKPQEKRDFETSVVEYECGGEMVKLSPSIIRKYLVNGNGNVTDQEIAMFLNLCRFQHLNPFLREAYLIKFGNQPATIATGKEAITKRAMRNPKYEGQVAGVVLWHNEVGELEYRTGALVMEGEQLVGGWAKVYVKGYQAPIEAVVSFQEYVGTKNDGTVNSQWSKRPATMIRKVALTQALREAFPEDLGGMYASEEMGLEFDETTMAPVDIQDPQVIEPEVIPDGTFPNEEPAQTTMDELQDF